MNALISDLRYSLRMVRKNPGYAAVTILLLGLGIGSNTALFSVANSVLLRPLPYRHPEQLFVTLHDGEAPVSPADYFDYKKSVASFQEMAAAQTWSGTLTLKERPEQIPGVRVSANMMHLLGVAPLLGRSFTPAEEHAGASQVLLLSHRLWQQQFAGNRGIIGRVVALDRVPYTVIGVMPPDFRFAPFWATRAQMWSPLDLDKRIADRDGRSLRVFARLKEGVTLVRAQAEMDAVAKHLADLYPATNAKLGISVVPLHEKVVRSVRPTLLVLLGTVGFVLLIACATVSNLMLARAVSRRKEIALRVALGASRGDLIRMTMVEIFLLAVLSGLAGVVLGSWAVQALSAMLPADSIPRLAELRFDRSALLFATAVTLVTALAAGLIPGMQAAQANLNEDLKTGNRGNSHGGRHKGFKSSFIAMEVALSLILLAGAGLMMRTMLALQAVDAGFNSHHLLTMQIAVSGTGFDADGRRTNLFREVRERLAAVPGVESVSAINHMPLGGDIWRLGYTIDGRARPADGDQLSAVYRVIMPGYFGTMQIGMLQGRAFDSHDNEAAAPVAIINEAMARRRWPGENPIGKTIRYGPSKQDATEPKTIVGIVRDARQNDWTSPALDEVYLPYYQRPDSLGLSYLTLVLRTRQDPDQMIDLVEQHVSAFEKSLPISEVISMDRVIADELWRQRLATRLIGAFAALAILLASVGIYGVISRTMQERTQEIGIRMALGAKSKDLVSMVLWEGMVPVLLGAVAGLLFALLLTRFLQTLLYGVTAVDPFTFTGITGGLMIVCILANLIPALRTTRVDPVIALRND